MKRSVGESLLFSAALILIIMAPGFLGGLESIQQECGLLIINALLFLLIFYSKNREGAFRKEAQEPNKKNIIVLIPVFAIFGIMLILCILSGFLDALRGVFSFVFYGDLSLGTFLTLLRIILSVLIEEMIFRMSFFNMIGVQNRALRVLISAVVFAVFDILLLLQKYMTFEYVLYSMIISFLLGIILGAIMEYGHCVYICMLLHFVFRFAFWDSQVLIAMLAWSGGTFFINPLIWLTICCAYLVVLYFTYFRKKEYGSYV